MSKKKLFLVALILSCNLGIYAQGVSLRLRNVTVAKAMTELRKKTGYSFVYEGSDLNTRLRVNVDAKDVRQAADQILGSQNVTYTIQGKNIVVSAKNKQSQGQTRPQYTVKKEAGYRTVKGHVTDENGEPIIGAAVREKGANNGVVTDLNGNFTIDVPDDASLIFSYVGTSDQELKASRNMEVTMRNNVENLNEVVVIGYGTIKKKDLTGSVATINGDNIGERHSTNLSNALQGAAAGLQVTRTSGAPGSTSSLLIRGVTTISDSSPLVIVDGVPGDMKMVNPDDVESVSVLKDAASAAIYGSRAAAGVILITTKRAKSGDFKLSYNFEYAQDSPTAHPKYVGATEYMKMVNETSYNDNPSGGWYQGYTQDVIDNYVSLHAQNPDEYAETDWNDVLFRSSAPRQTHTIDLVAGAEKLRSKISLRYDNIGSILEGNNSSREHYLARINNDFLFNKYVEAHADVNFRLAKAKEPNYNVFSEEGRAIPAIYPARWSDGRYADVKDGSNPLANISPDAGNVHYDNYHVGFKGEINIKPFDGLKISMVAAPNFDFLYTKKFVKQMPYTKLEDPNVIAGYFHGLGIQTTQLTENRNKNKDITMQFLVNYNKSFGKHDLALLGGYEYYYAKYDNMWGKGDNFELTSFPYLDLAPSDYQSTGGNATEYSYRSWFGRVNYSYDNKYLLEANIRYDGSSRFSSDNRWAAFPSVSLGWVITEEKFMKATRSWLDQLKLRASWGKLGNERIGSYYPYQAAISFNQVAITDGGVVSGVTAASQTDYAVRNITWETTTSWDLGLDAMFLNSRLYFNFDAYRKNTSDMLLAVQIPIFLGYNNPSVNAGDMHTTGWDFNAGWRDHVGDFNYNVSFNLSNAKSKMGNMRNTIFYNGDYISREGTEYNQFYGYHCLGIYQTQDQVDQSARLNDNIKVGDLQYEDISGPDGVPDGKISAEYDRIPLKSSMPHYIYGLTFNADWQGFDASIVIQGVGEQWARNDAYRVQGYTWNWLSFPKVIEGKYWSANNSDEQNAAATYPRLTYANRDANYAMSDYWLYNNHYLRLKNITLGYTLPKNITKKFFIERLRVYVAANDLFSINNCLDGWDPESQTFSYPVMRSLMFGVNVNF